MLFETRSPLSGRIRVVQRGRERRLLIGGEIQSVFVPDGDWSVIAREYWTRALAPAARLAARPRALLIGLGGGTQAHLLRRTLAPRLTTAVERDPAVARVAREWFGLAEIGGIEILCADASVAVRHLALARRRFDYVMDDISYAAPPADAIALARSLAGLLAAGGVLVLNQHRRAAARALAAGIADLLPGARLVRVRRGAENVLVVGRRPRPSG